MNTDHFDDIEQMLKPQCEFKASESLKQNVMAKARQEVCPHRTIRLWPWVAAACVAGFLMLYFMPPETASRDAALHARLVKAYQTDRLLILLSTSKCLIRHLANWYTSVNVLFSPNDILIAPWI